MTRTTAASVNMNKGDPGSYSHQGNLNTRNRAGRLSQVNNKAISRSAVNKLTKPSSHKFSQSKTMKTAGEILNYPYSFDQELRDDDLAALDNQLAKQQYEEQYRVAEIQNQQLFSPIREEFKGAKEVARAIFDMTEIEGLLEKKRRELVLRSDFNLCDTFKMFGGLSKGIQGIDCDDLFSTITQNLDLTVTKDEVFILFYKIDKDGDGLISYEELSNCFMPRSHEYAVLLQSRGGFYGSESDYKKYFEGPTRDLIRVFIRGFIDCEVSIEHVRQRICNKLKMNNYTIFCAIDELNRGSINIDDFRLFIKKANLYPIEKNLILLFERFDKYGTGYVKFEDFVAAITPFMNNEQF
uniref:EF-hand domain-containing protein n=1 Tax=Strombidium rassoulzadegani TaxID=1082188 RepID=A0A7S3CLS2_9SPIT|mmetsp:Transcript_16086/g.27161  ORF Transcript_16086/g.27161 Transcript_16086/m.27161 type:complete len:353 (+) Transcript_16086:880-1938(+)